MEERERTMKEKALDHFALCAILMAVICALVLLLGSLLFATPELPSDKTFFISTDYEAKLFDSSYVHEIDIQIPKVNWDYMVLHAMEEQYVHCDVVIDGETIRNVAIRPKGNSSLAAIKKQGSDRFSFKIEFDHYRDNITYHGLDKLALNNLGQDVSCMKDFLTYQMMNAMGVPSPLTSYTHVTLNGKDFGLYLAVEAIEDSFAYRNYGTSYGNLYKPECFVINNVTPSAFAETEMDSEIFSRDYSTLGKGERFDILGTFVEAPFNAAFGNEMQTAAFHYLGDEEERYKVFFDSAVFKETKKSKTALIQAIKTLNSPDYRSAIDEDSLIPYFVVHNFVNNYDSYTGVFVHNYYLREKDGKLSLIPWDYNLACGVFTIGNAMKSFLGSDSPYMVDLQVGEAMDDSTSMVNYPIDTPTFTVTVEDRPLLSAVLLDPELKEKYHEEFTHLLSSFFASGRFEACFQHTREIIRPYVEDNLTFYSPEKVAVAMDAVHDYFTLRTESVQRQLEGNLPSTMEGQKEDYQNLVDASTLDLSSTVTFDGLVFGISTEDVYAILDSLAGDNPHSAEGLSQSFSEMKEEPKKILTTVGRVITGSKLIYDALIGKILGPVLLVLSIILLCIVRKKTIRYERRKPLRRKSK